jgi:hypothetical protein
MRAAATVRILDIVPALDNLDRVHNLIRERERAKQCSGTKGRTVNFLSETSRSLCFNEWCEIEKETH